MNEEMLQRARDEQEYLDIAERFTCEYTGNPNHGELHAYMLEHHRESLSLYKLGYNYLVLFKQVGIVNIADFMTQTAKDLLALDLPTTDDWHVHALLRLKQAWLKEHYNGDMYDNRSSVVKFKPTADRLWEDNKKEILR